MNRKINILLIAVVLTLIISGAEILREADFYEKLDKRYVRCDLCPNHCVLKPSETGICRVRKNIDGILYSLVYNKPCSINIDPIEKKPLYHVLPGTKVLSLATVGCNLNCSFCQNWTISQSSPETTSSETVTPQQVIELAQSYQCQSIAFTYTEPTVYYEYMYDIAKLAQETGIFTVWVTCGYINEEPLRKLAPYIDAANIDLKGFSNEFYQTYTTGNLDPVLHSLLLAKETGIFVEVTNLLIPDANDQEENLQAMCKWLYANMGADCPLHFSRFFPNYQLMNKPQTPVQTIRTALRIAENAGLNYVYAGNISGVAEDTRCPVCGELLIKRSGYQILQNNLENGKCPNCQTDIPGIFVP